MSTNSALPNEIWQSIISQDNSNKNKNREKRKKIIIIVSINIEIWNLAQAEKVFMYVYI